MKKTQGLHLSSLILNLAIVALTITGFALTHISTADFSGGKIFLYYHVIAGCITVLASFLMIVPNIISIKKGKDSTPKLFFNLRFISAVMSLVTLALAIYVIIDKKIAIKTVSASEILLFFAVPGISILEFVFTELEPECKFRKTFVPLIFTILYAIAVVATIGIVGFSNQNVSSVAEFQEKIASFIPYDFFRLHPSLIPEGSKLTVVGNAITLTVCIVISYVISFVIWCLNRIASAIIVGVTYGETKKEEKEEVKGNVSSRIRKHIRKSLSTHEHDNDDEKVYHISYHDRKKKTWKVKGELAGRANKVFSTQKEAIDFANELVKKNGGSIRIHSMVGRIRKDW